jgi:hypothetical protein
MMADKAGLELETLAGMAYDPLSGLWRMTENTGVNYIAYFQKSGLVTGEPCAAVLHSQRSNACNKISTRLSSSAQACSCLTPCSCIVVLQCPLGWD